MVVVGGFLDAPSRLPNMPTAGGEREAVLGVMVAGSHEWMRQNVKRHLISSRGCSSARPSELPQNNWAMERCGAKNSALRLRSCCGPFGVRNVKGVH